MRNKRKINLANCDFNFQNKNNLNTNKVKVISADFSESLQRVEQQKVKTISSDLKASLQTAKRQKIKTISSNFGNLVHLRASLRTTKKASGITLIALVVTIVVLLILAGVSISTVLGNNGIIPRANEAKFKTELANIQEEFKLYVIDKTAENSDFSVGSLNASSDLLTYNTQPEEEKGTGNISTVLKSSTAQKYIQSKSFSIIKGDLIYASQNAKELEWAQEVGLAINPYNIDERGVLLSSDTNLMLMDKATGTLVIPEMVKIIGEGTFGNVKGLKKIIIPPTVVELGNNAFRANTDIEEVIIQTSQEEGQGLKKIGNHAFAGCTKITTFSIPDTVTYMGGGAFRACSKLHDVKLSSNANLGDSLFADCTSIETIVIPEGVNAITNWGTFYSCISLKTVHIPSTMKSISDSGFQFCGKIESIILPETNNNFILENGILLSGDRTQMIIVTKSAINESGIFTVPEGVTKLPTRLISNYNLHTVIIPASVTQLGGTSFPPRISEIRIHEDNPQYKIYNGNICDREHKILYVCMNKNATVNVDEGIEVIKQGAFKTCSNVRTIVFPDSVTTLDTQIFIESIVQNIKFGVGLKNIHPDAFNYNSSIKNIEISTDNPNYMAENNVIYNKEQTKLVRLVNDDVEACSIPNTVHTIGENAFLGRIKLKRVDIPNSVKTIEDRAFCGCTVLTTLYIPESVNSIGVDVFDSCSNLTTIQINKQKGSISGSTWGTTIGERAIKWLQ